MKRALKRAAVIRPFCGERVLLQLRDENPHIVHPGRWGFFSGTVELDETPLQSAKRELMEDLGGKLIRHIREGCTARPSPEDL